MRAFQPCGNTYRLDVDTSSDSVRILPTVPGDFNAYRIMNNGPNEAYVALGGTAAPTAAIQADKASGVCFCIPAGAVEYIVGPSNAWVAAISAATETAQLFITPGVAL